MANTRSANTDVAERLQQKKIELTQLIDRQPIIHNNGMDKAVFAELQLQIKTILRKSKKSLLALTEKMIDGLDAATMEALEDEINDTLFTLKNTEEREISKAYQTSQDIVRLQNTIKSEKETPARPVTPPTTAEVETPTASPTQEKLSILTNARNMVNGLMTNGLFATTATPEPKSPKKIPPTSTRDNLSPEALALKNQFNKKSVLFPYPEQSKDAPLTTSTDEKAPEPQQPTTIITTRKRVRRVKTNEFSTQRTPTQAN